MSDHSEESKDEAPLNSLATDETGENWTAAPFSIDAIPNEDHRIHSSRPLGRDLSELLTVRPLLALFVPLLLLSSVLALLHVQGNITDPTLLVENITDPTLLVGSFHVPTTISYFQGRETEMNHLKEMLNTTNSATVAVHGLGGVGKSQLVVSWVNKNKDQYGAIIWLRAEQEYTLINDLASYSFAAGLSSPLDSEAKTEEIASLVIRAIEAHGKNEPRILLVYDNAESVDAVETWMPTFGSACHTIITTRDSGGNNEGSLLKLGPLDPESSILIVEHFIKRPINAEEGIKLLEVLGTFDYLPLAIVAFSIQARDLGVSRATSRYRETLNESLKLGRDFPGYNREPLYAVLRIQVDGLSSEARVALGYLYVLNVEHTGIPLSMLEASWTESANLTIALDELQERVFLRFDHDHTMIDTVFQEIYQEIVWETVSEGKRAKILDGVRSKLQEWTEGIGMTPGRRDEALLGVTLANIDFLWPDEPLSRANLCFRIAAVNYHAGNYAESLALFNKAFPTLILFVGSDKPNVINTLSSMASVYDDHGLYEKALELFQQAFSVEEASLGDDQLSVASIWNNMTSTYQNHGLDYRDTITESEKALKVALTSGRYDIEFEFQAARLYALRARILHYLGIWDDCVKDSSLALDWFGPNTVKDPSLQTMYTKSKSIAEEMHKSCGAKISKPVPMRTAGFDFGQQVILSRSVPFSALLIILLVIFRRRSRSLCSNREGNCYGVSPTVFVSHTGQDKPSTTFATFVCDSLKRNHSVHTFLDASDLKTGILWEKEIERKVQTCEAFVCILSGSYFSRYWCLHELDLATRAKRKIVPVYHDSGHELPKVDDALRNRFCIILRRKRRLSVYDEMTVVDRWCGNIRKLAQVQGCVNQSAEGFKLSELKFRDKVVADILDAIETGA